MKRWMVGAVVLCCLLASGCSSKSDVRTDGYENLIGVSLTNVMEPWLNNLAQVLEEKAGQQDAVNLIFRDAAGSTEKQIQDIEALMECGIDLLILSPDGSGDLNEVMEEVFEKIPVVVVGAKPETEAYTTFIQADDEKIGELAAEYILEHLYKKNARIMVIEGVEGSPISQRRLSGFTETVQKEIEESSIAYAVGDWLRDTAELRMKDYLVVNGPPDIVFAFNDEMAYGAYIACQKFRMDSGVRFLGVDGFEGESAGLNLVEREILTATIQSPDFGALAYDTALDILKGENVERNITVEPCLITGN